MSRKTSNSPTSSATPDAGPAESSNSPSSADSISAVAPNGDRRATLVAIRNRLADETDDTTWAKHKNECTCVCGMGDGRLLVALTKELRTVDAEIAALPEPKGASKLDEIASSVADLDKHRRSRTPRRTDATGS